MNDSKTLDLVRRIDHSIEKRLRHMREHSAVVGDSIQRIIMTSIEQCAYLFISYRPKNVRKIIIIII